MHYYEIHRTCKKNHKDRQNGEEKEIKMKMKRILAHVLPSHPTVLSSWRAVSCIKAVAKDDKDNEKR